MNEKLEDSLKTLLETGREKGYLTYGQVNDYLPDDDASPDKIDQLLMLLESHDIQLIDESEVEEREAKDRPGTDDSEGEIDLGLL